MSWLNKHVIRRISPGWALSRARADRMVRAYYEAAEPSRTNKWRTDRRSANETNERAVQPIRAQARHLDENFDLASGILDVLVANTVGTGIQPEPQVMLKDGQPAEEVNRALMKLFEDWRFRPEVTWSMDYYQQQRTTARSWFRDGEIFTQKIIGSVPGLDHGTLVKYSLEALEADFVPMDYNVAERGIRQGIECSAWGRPRAYHCYKGHPGDSIYYSPDLKRIPAEQMMHLAFRKRFHQLRGMSVFASVVRRLDDIKEIDEFERIACKVASSMTAVITKGQGTDYEEQQLDADGNPVQREMTFEPGLIFDDLQPGESIETIDTKRPNTKIIEFRDANMRAAASGVGASFSSIAKNYLGTYSSQRQELVESFVQYQMLAAPIVYNFCQPTWDGFVDAALLSPGFTLPRDVDLDTLYDCSHTGPSMPWVDPEKEVRAQVEAIKWRLTSRSKCIRQRGDNPDQVNREIVRDEQEMERLGIEIISDKADSPAPAKQGAPNQKPKPGDEPEDQE